VNAPQITDQLFKSNLTFCVVYVFTLTSGAFSVHSLRVFNANLEDKFKFKYLNEHPIYMNTYICINITLFGFST
jgi:hypothetical protein